tara:strand:- start:120 stop:287 length:168 start_codon:yes stop_codon:yes gene_type:complete
MNIYIIGAMILVGLAVALVAMRVIAPRLPRRPLVKKNIRDRHGNVVGVEQTEVKK